MEGVGYCVPCCEEDGTGIIVPFKPPAPVTPTPDSVGFGVSSLGKCWVDIEMWEAWGIGDGEVY